MMCGLRNRCMYGAMYASHIGAQSTRAHAGMAAQGEQPTRLGAPNTGQEREAHPLRWHRDAKRRAQTLPSQGQRPQVIRHSYLDEVSEYPATAELQDDLFKVVVNLRMIPYRKPNAIIFDVHIHRRPQRRLRPTARLA